MDCNGDAKLGLRHNLASETVEKGCLSALRAIKRVKTGFISLVSVWDQFAAAA